MAIYRTNKYTKDSVWLPSIDGIPGKVGDMVKAASSAIGNLINDTIDGKPDTDDVFAGYSKTMLANSAAAGDGIVTLHQTCYNFWDEKLGGPGVITAAAVTTCEIGGMLSAIPPTAARVVRQTFSVLTTVPDNLSEWGAQVGAAIFAGVGIAGLVSLVPGRGGVGSGVLKGEKIVPSPLRGQAHFTPIKEGALPTGSTGMPIYRPIRVIDSSVQVLKPAPALVQSEFPSAVANIPQVAGFPSEPLILPKLEGFRPIVLPANFGQMLAEDAQALSDMLNQKSLTDVLAVQRILQKFHTIREGLSDSDWQKLEGLAKTPMELHFLRFVRTAGGLSPLHWVKFLEDAPNRPLNPVAQTTVGEFRIPGIVNLVFPYPGSYGPIEGLCLEFTGKEIKVLPLGTVIINDVI